MAPSAVDELPILSLKSTAALKAAAVASADGPIPGTRPEDLVSSLTAPLVYSGSLDAFKHRDSNPIMGREYEEALQAVDLMEAPNSDALMRDLAIQSRCNRYPGLEQLLIRRAQSPNAASYSSRTRPSPPSRCAC